MSDTLLKQQLFCALVQLAKDEDEFPPPEVDNNLLTTADTQAAAAQGLQI
jgi:hypothetical protein